MLVKTRTFIEGVKHGKYLETTSLKADLETVGEMYASKGAQWFEWCVPDPRQSLKSVDVLLEDPKMEPWVKVPL